MPVGFSGGASSPRLSFDAGLLHGGAQTPFQRTVEPKTLGLFINIEQRDLQRLRRYEEHWRFYLGEHWSFRREDGEPLVTVNLLRVLIDKGVTWLVSKGFKIDIPDPLVDVMLPPLKETWEANNKMELLQEIAQMGGVTGDTWIMVTPVETDLQRGTDDVTAIKIQLYGSEAVFPVWDPLNVHKLLGIKIINVFVDESGYGAEAPRQSGQPNIRRFTQIIMPDKIIEQREGEQPVEKENPLGEIPMVHIRNLAVAREFWGLSDMDGGLIDLQRELNEKATDVSDIINYHAHPITVIIGAKVKNLEKGPKRVWSGFPAGTVVSNLQMDSNLPASMDYIKQIQKWMLETGEMPEGSLGGTQQISNTSGVAIMTQFQSIVERTQRKRPQYERGLSEINYFILRWYELLNKWQAPTNFCKHCGGKILEVAVKDKQGNLRRRKGRVVFRPTCFHADPWTDDFIDPDDLKVKFVRQFSFGNEIAELPRWQMVAEVLNEKKSFWDPVGSASEGEKPLSSSEAQKAAAEEEKKVREQGNIPAPPTEPIPEPQEGAPPPPPGQPQPGEKKPTIKSLKLPEGSIQVPYEPVNVDLLLEVFEGGTVRRELTKRFLVPTGCAKPYKFNPWNVPVNLHDALPRDEHLDAQLCVQLVAAGIWSRREAMRRMKVENPEQMLKEVEAETPMKEAGGVTGDDIPATVLQGEEEARQASRGGANNPAPFQPPKPSPGRPPTPGEK